jgi:lipopolysaccharide export system protein LptA
MRVTIARLRLGILILAGLLAAVLLSFFFYARYRLRHFEKDLPARLGIDIQQTANGYTYSQSSKGHTLYTIHASKLIQYKKGGNATLRDVAITLYGPEGSNRIDKISGSEFNYDAKNQVVSAQGTVAIDLQGFGNASMSPENAIHINTSGLVFNQKTGEADTSQHTVFVFPKASGSSMGAHYNSKTGMLVLDSQIEMTTTDKDGRPAVLHATHAQIERGSKQVFLLNPRTEYQSENAFSDAAIISLREDGSAQTIDARGNVRVVTADGAVVRASNSLTQLNEQSQPVQTDMAGGVTYVSTTPDEVMHGTAVSAALTFGPNSMLKHAQFLGAVSFVDQVLHLPNDPRGNASRQVETSKLDVDFVAAPDGKKSVPQKALATGMASVNLRTIPSKGAEENTAISGDQLLALLTPDGRSIRQLNGAGHTKIVDLAKDGSTNTSAGDRLVATFNTQKPEAKSHSLQTAQTSQVESAIQDGHVVLTQTPQKKQGSAANPATLTAWAQHAEYHAGDGILHLTGSPHLYDGESLQMSAARIDFHRDTGDAVAEGSVKTTYSQPKARGTTTPVSSGPNSSAPSLGGNGPVNITADHAVLIRASGASTFYGAGRTDARIWQEANSILAPVIEITHSPQTLKAFGNPGSTAAVVNANLLSPSSGNHQAGIIRIHSQALSYSDADRIGDFRGSVIAEDSNGTIHADQAQVYLTPASKANKQEQAQLDHIIASGHVTLTQPGRKGTGEKLTYIADDGKYILTGTAGNPPRIEDAAKGTTTGTTLIFNSQDDSVVVSGGQSSAVTETRSPK